MPTIRLFPDVETPSERLVRPLKNPEDLKPFLLDPDRHVRERVAQYFAESYSRDPDLLGLVLDACEQYGDVENNGVLARASRFELSEENFLRTHERLSEADEYKPCAHYGSILANAPAEWLLKHKTKLEETGRLIEGVIDKMNWRFTFMDYSPEEAWEELQEYSRESRGSNLSDVDHDRVNCLLEVLVCSEVPEDQRVIDLLRDEDVEEEWLEVWLVKLAGLRRMSAAVPRLVEYLQLDTGYFRERVVDALARIGAPEAVRLIDETFCADPEHVKSYGSEVPARIKSRVSEKFFLHHLDGENDLTIRTYLCDGLCRLFSRRGVKRVRRQVHRGYNEGLLSLEEALLDVAAVLDIDLPKADEWRREREQKERRRRERQEELAQLARCVRADENERVTTAGSTSRSRPKKDVGRNDPCPCGSGRKYKRCCGDPRKN